MANAPENRPARTRLQRSGLPRSLRLAVIRALAVAALLALLLAGAACGDDAESSSVGERAAAAVPASPPEASDLGDELATVARPADDVAHPGSETEWWYVHAIDPVSGQVVIASFFIAPVSASGGFLYTEEEMRHWTSPSETLPHSGPGVTLRDGGVSLDEASGTWIVDQKSGGTALHLELTDTLPGATAGPLRFGDEEMSWTVPVATGVANGWFVDRDGERTEIRDWRAYHDHNWGDFALESTQSAGWEWAAVHEAPGHARILGGINQLNGDFDGALLNVTPSATTGCRPTLEKDDWTTVDGFAYPQTVEASCDGEVVRFTVTRPYVAPFTTHALTESVGRTDTPGSLGLIEHFAPREEPS